MQQLPAYFYRTTLLVLDDDHLFSSTVAALLNHDFQVITFNSPEKMLQYLADYQLPPSHKNSVRDSSAHDYYDTAAHTLVDMNIPSLHQHTTNPANINEISIIISDFDMPNMSGVDVFKQLTHIPAKKILLTGAADQQIAIEAFNNNVIDRYIRKDSPTIAQEIKSHAKMLASAYFLEQSKPLLSHLEARRPSPLTDIHFADFFRRWCLDNQIQQYTLIDKNGSFSVVDKEQNERYFILHTDDSLNAFLDLNDDEEKAATHLAAINARSIIPFFGIGVDSWEVEPTAWSQYCHPASTLRGREKYYWSVIDADQIAQ